MNRKWIFWIAIFCLGCKGRAKAPAPVKHLAMVHQRGSTLYVDRLDNRVVLQSADTSGSTHFCSFLIGWKDSVLSADAARRLETEKYFQYSMQQDWSAVVDGDTLRPVFFQEKAGLNAQLKEAAMVFEIPKGHRADTLVYRDTYSAWGTQIFVLNGK